MAETRTDIGRARACMHASIDWLPIFPIFHLLQRPKVIEIGGSQGWKVAQKVEFHASNFSLGCLPSWAKKQTFALFYLWGKKVNWGRQKRPALIVMRPEFKIKLPLFHYVGAYVTLSCSSAFGSHIPWRYRSCKPKNMVAFMFCIFYSGSRVWILFRLYGRHREMEQRVLLPEFRRKQRRFLLRNWSTQVLLHQKGQSHSGGGSRVSRI